MKKEKIKVGFTKYQHDMVHDFLTKMRTQIEQDLGGPVKVTVNWGTSNDIVLQGSKKSKTIPIKNVLETAQSFSATARVGRPVAVNVHE